MNKLLHFAHTNDKDELIKKSIINQLSNNIKELQYSGLQKDSSSNITDSTEAASQLCIIIEALFLHGIRDSLTHRFRRVLADVGSRPEPSFWAPILVISHRQIIDQIAALTQITTETGQCRAWIRQALNDCILSSYISTMRKDSSSLKNYYRVGAFVRDSEMLDVAQNLVEGFENFNCVSFPCNSSLLNTWPPASLYLAGIWAPTLKTCPIAPCDDVVQSIEETSIQQLSENMSDTNSMSSAFSFTSQTSGFREMMAFNEDEVLKMILKKSEETESANSEGKPTHISELKKPRRTDRIIVGNSVNATTGWSFDNIEEEVACAAPAPENDDNEALADDSFNTFVDSYNLLQGDYIGTPNLKNVWQRIDEMHEDVVTTKPTVIKENTKLAEETVPNVAAVKRSCESLAQQLGKICKEKGLDKQNFECLGCRAPFLAEQKLNVCAFTGDYYCDSCMSDIDISIPSRIIHNWDFAPYRVSQKCFNYINEIKDHPLLDFKVLNPLIYSVVREMSELQSLRNQLNYIRAYLYTCRNPVIGELQKLMYPREYLFEHVHQYSVNDLSEITNGELAQCLQRGVNFGKEHVTTCWLCSQKGFVCEICKNPKTIFPFDVEEVYSCNDCNAVYHKHCLTVHRSCKKCKRKKKREEALLVEDSLNI